MTSADTVDSVGSTLARQPRIGVVMLEDPLYDVDEYVFRHGEIAFPHRPPGFMNHPDTWSCDTVFRVARGCTGDDTAQRTARAYDGLRRAAEALDGRVDIITTNCAYTWYLRESFGSVRTLVVPSAMALLASLRELCRELAVVVSHSPTVRKLMGPCPPGMRMVELEGLPEWHYFHSAGGADRPPNQDQMRSELVERIERDLYDNGRPSAVLLECSGLPQFRDAAISSYGAPVFDIVTYVHGLLGLGTPRFQPMVAP
jgi:hypothetical protein